jgi:hypothetical protein
MEICVKFREQLGQIKYLLHGGHVIGSILHDDKKLGVGKDA